MEDDKTMEEKSRDQQPVWKSFLFAIVVLAILIPIVLGFSAVKIPFWPILVFMFYYAVILHLEPSKFYTTAVGGLIGILVSFSGTIFGYLMGKAVGELIYLVFLAALITALIDGRIKYVNDSSNLFLISLTAIASSDVKIENFLPVLVSYLIAVSAFFLFVKVIRRFFPGSVSKLTYQKENP